MLLRTRITEFQPAGLVLRRRVKTRFTVAYGEILTAERLHSARRLRLHVRTMDPVLVTARPGERLWIEDELRRRGVRVVDSWGAIIAPTLLDFEEELAQEPVRLRQSSDNG